MATGPQVPEPAHRVAEVIAQAGGQAWLVGGWVRDQFLKRPGMDLDLEVSGLSATEIETHLSRLGPVSRVGRAFPVFKLRIGSCTLDIAQPRSNSLPDGRAQVDPTLPIEESAARRDLTINAIALNPLTGQVCDPFGGKKDLENRRLRAVEPSLFLDDTLRVLRVARFAAQLHFHPDDELIALCLTAQWSGVASERIGIEISKMLCAPHPRHGLEIAQKLGIWRHLLPELEDLPLSPSADALDRLPALVSWLGSESRLLTVGLAILLHRLEGDSLETAMDRLDVHRRDGLNLRHEIRQAIIKQAELRRDCRPSALRWAAEDSELVLALGLALSLEPRDDLQESLALAREMGILHASMLPLIMGRDLIAYGIPSGTQVGELLEQVRAEQLDGRISTPEEALRFVEDLAHLEP